MNHIRSTRIALSLAMAGLFMASAAYAQPPAAAAGRAQGAAPVRAGGAGRGGGLPAATPEQNQAVTEMNAALMPLMSAVTMARNDLATVTFADVKSDAGIKAAVDKLRAAELALATKRAEEFVKLQASPNKLNAEQVTALIASGGALPAGRGGGGAGPGRGAAPGAAGPGRGAAPARGN